MKLTFTVPGEPQGKGRPRFSSYRGKVNARTPYETVVYENLIQMEYRRANGNKKFEAGEMLEMRVVAYYSIPESASKKKKREMEEGELRPVKKPDADNILKVVADSLNKIAYHDDAQLVDTHIKKLYSRNPRLEITIQNA